MAEGTHLLEVLGLVFLWLLARSVPDAGRPRRSIPQPGSGGGSEVEPVARLRSLPARFGVTPSAPAPATAHERDGERRVA
jgi:hypothetical protein